MSDIPAFFWNKEVMPDSGELFELEGQEARHGTKVLRLKADTLVKLVDGRGHIALCTIVEIKRSSLKLRADKLLSMAPDLCPVFLAISVLKSDKMDLVIQKCTEIGIEKIYPIYATRSVVRMNRDKQQKRLERWHEIARQALKQCRGAYLTQINQPVDFWEFMEFSRGLKGAKIVLCERHGPEHSPRQAWGRQGNQRPITLLVGPEGGFSGAERRIAAENGFHSASLGKRILRAETAAIGVSFLFRQWLNEKHHGEQTE